MTTDRDIHEYQERLLTALRMREVSGTRIGEVLAEVESHVTETGEDPRTAFGEPTAYASNVAGGRSPWRLGPRTLLAAAVFGIGAAAATYLLMDGAVSLAANDAVGVFGLSAVTLLVTGAVGVALVALALTAYTKRVQELVIDPRTGRPMRRSPHPALMLASASGRHCYWRSS